MVFIGDVSLVNGITNIDTSPTTIDTSYIDSYIYSYIQVIPGEEPAIVI